MTKEQLQKVTDELWGRSLRSSDDETKTAIFADIALSLKQIVEKSAADLSRGKLVITSVREEIADLWLQLTLNDLALAESFVAKELEKRSHDSRNEASTVLAAIRSAIDRLVTRRSNDQ